MASYRFYIWFAVFVELFPLVPFLVGVQKWKVIPLGLRYFLGFLLADFIINLVSNYLFLIRINNHFLYYLYSFQYSIFLLPSLRQLSRYRAERLIITILIAFSLLILIIDFFFISKIGTNYLSGLLINFFIFLISIYFSAKEFGKNGKSGTNDLFLNITLILSLQFFIKSIETFLGKYLLETQTNAFTWIQARNLYSYFMLFSLIAYTYVFSIYKTDET